MRTIFRYNVPFGDEVTVQMPKDALILKFGIRRVLGNKPDIEVWAIVEIDDNLEAEMEERRFRIYGTGHPLPDGTADSTWNSNSQDYYYKYFDTLFDRHFVWHIFVGYDNTKGEL